MFHVDFESEQTKNIINFAKYAATAIAVAIITIILVFAASGYDIDRDTGKIIQNGLVIVASEPVSADVYINSNNEDDPTASKFSLPEGQYTFELKRDGYHNWAKKVSIKGSEVVWLQYPRLIPQELKTVNYQAFKGIDMVSQTPDRKFALLHRSDSDNNFILLGLESTEGEPETITLPESVFTIAPDAKSKFAVLDWAQDSRTVVMKHTNGSTSEIILFNTTRAEEAVNLTKLYELNLSKLRFIDTSRDRLYALVGSSLRVLDVSGRIISASLIDNVREYVPKDGIVVALNKNDDTTKVSMLDGDEVFIVMDLNDSPDKYILGTNIYDGVRYLTVADNVQNKAFIYKDFVSTAKAGESPKLLNILRSENTELVSSSPNGQFVLAQSDKSFRLYDFDIEEKRAFNLQYYLAEKTEPLWIDSHHLSLVDGENQAHFVDYDGLNDHVLAKIDVQFKALYMHDIEGLFFFPNDNKSSDILEFTSLVVEN